MQTLTLLRERERGKVQTERKKVMATRVTEIDTSTIGLIPGTDNQAGGDIYHLFTTIPRGGQGDWHARVGCNQEYANCPVKGGSEGIICDAVNTDRSAWERNRVVVPLSGAVFCGKAPSIKSSIDATEPANDANLPPVFSELA